MKIMMYPQTRGTLVSLGDLIKWMQAIGDTLDGQQESTVIDAMVTTLADMAAVARAAKDEYAGRN